MVAAQLAGISAACSVQQISFSCIRTAENSLISQLQHCHTNYDECRASSWFIVWVTRTDYWNKTTEVFSSEMKSWMCDCTHSSLYTGYAGRNARCKSRTSVSIGLFSFHSKVIGLSDEICFKRLDVTVRRCIVSNASANRDTWPKEKKNFIRSRTQTSTFKS